LFQLAAGAACSPSHTQNARHKLLKPKFHYTDFATKSVTKITKVHDTNYVADFHDLWRGLSWFVSATKSTDFIVDFPSALID